MDILALDFDGVICNSAAEAAVAGWKGAVRLWPRQFAGDAPEHIVEKFLKVRPVMETGYESLLLVRLLWDGCPVDEILENHAALFSGLIRHHFLEKDQLVRVFGQVRDAWIADDADGWLGAHEFYHGVAAAVNQSDVPVYIITTKQKRFVTSLSAAAGIQIADNHIYGLESGQKSDVLIKLSRRHPGSCIHFVEDRLAALTNLVSQIDLNIRLYFARWGYNTVNEQAAADNDSNIVVLTQDRFVDLVKMLSRSVQD